MSDESLRPLTRGRRLLLCGRLGLDGQGHTINLHLGKLLEQIFHFFLLLNDIIEESEPFRQLLVLLVEVHEIDVHHDGEGDAVLITVSSSSSCLIVRRTCIQ
jgi:hypothetical protein